MSPGARRARAADYSFGALRLLVAAQQEAEQGELDVDADHIVEGVALLADQYLAAADVFGRRRGPATPGRSLNPKKRRGSA
jgi:hypothetical protein